MRRHDPKCEMQRRKNNRMKILFYFLFDLIFNCHFRAFRLAIFAFSLSGIMTCLSQFPPAAKRRRNNLSSFLNQTSRSLYWNTLSIFLIKLILDILPDIRKTSLKCSVIDFRKKTYTRFNKCSKQNR